MPRLLLADDSVTVQRVIQLTFAGEDVAVETVSDGDQAIARLEQDPPDIVLADVRMPGKDGYEVARFLKRTPRLSRIPIVLLTSALEPVDRERAAASKCDGVLSKPFEPQLVIATVRELLGRAAAAPVAQTNPQPVAVAASAPTAPRASATPPKNAEYFERLDAKFADLTNRPSAPPVAKPAPSIAPEVGDGPLPSLADAFAAILAAEQRESGAGVDVVWPAASPAAPAITDAFVDEIVGRVLARLSDHLVHDAVANTVSPIAERLVREEIERIKASVK